jgi:hypothetical protein
MARMQGFDSSAPSPSSSGIIVPFLANKTIFITGATGFLAKGRRETPNELPCLNARIADRWLD